ncbi:MAG: hypothetical protein GF334_10955 [Candidatus Altiarchaeales archaeon]|nr:hypothetical protein [Candidatus Altiarchaeales archaeon]
MIDISADELKALEARIHAFNTLFSNVQRERIFVNLIHNIDSYRAGIPDPEIDRLTEICSEDNFLIHLDRITSKKDILYFFVMPFEDLPMYIEDSDHFKREYVKWRLENSIVLNPNSPSYKPWHNGTLPRFPKRGIL